MTIPNELTSLSYTQNLNVFSFIKLRISFINSIEKSFKQQNNFFDYVTDIVKTYFSYINCIDVNINYENLSKQVALTVYYINSHIYETLTPSNVMDALNFDKAYTAKLFKKELNFTINYYIKYLKLQEAKNLLIQENISIEKIARLLKFYDSPSFSKDFKKQFSVSPTKFRELNKLKLSNKKS